MTTNWLSVHFVSAYTQIISLSVYSYLYSHLFGRQFIEPEIGDTETTPEDEFSLLKPSKLTLVNHSLFKRINWKTKHIKVYNFSCKDRPIETQTLKKYLLIYYVLTLQWLKCPSDCWAQLVPNSGLEWN